MRDARGPLTKGNPISCNPARVAEGRMTFDQLRRREFISLAGGAVAALPVAARSQPTAMPVVALVNPGTADATTNPIQLLADEVIE